MLLVAVLVRSTLASEDRPELSNIAGWTIHQGNTVSPSAILPSENAVLNTTQC